MELEEGGGGKGHQVQKGKKKYKIKIKSKIPPSADEWTRKAQALD